MTPTGDDDLERPPNSPPHPATPPPGPRVERPRFGDSPAAEYSPAYGAQPPPPVPPTGTPDGYSPAAPQSPPTVAPPPPTRTPGSRRSMLAPLAAAIVLVGGIAFLVLRGGSEAVESTDGPGISGVEEPDEPRVDTTVPLQTSPPLVDPTTTIDTPTTQPAPSTTTATTTTTSTTSTTTTTTSAPASTGGPTVAEVEASLLNIDELGDGNWTEEPINLIEVCGANPEIEAIDIRRDRLFQEVLIDPIAVRQVGSTLLSYPDDETAIRALDSEVALLEACDATTVDFDGVSYRVQVNSDSFTPEQSATFPCADQSAFLILQLTNENAAIPYIGQTSISFRCGRNITVSSLTTTIDVDDLTDDDFFNAAGLANIRAGSLAGS